jgi:hypothetical protein
MKPKRDEKQVDITKIGWIKWDSSFNTKTFSSLTLKNKYGKEKL